MTDELIEAMARASAAADGLDYDEVCGKDTEAEECDSGTCVAAYSEDHEAEECRAWYRRQAAAALAAARETHHLIPNDQEPVEYHYHKDGQAMVTLKRMSADCREGWTETPLFALPPTEDTTQ